MRRANAGSSEGHYAGELRYQLFFERNQAGAFRLSAGGTLLDCNEACARLFEFESRAELLSAAGFDFFGSIFSDSRLLKSLEEGRFLANVEIVSRSREGRPLFILASISFIEGIAQEEDFIEGTLVDITARKVAEERMEFLAFHDPVTVLPNRKLFVDRLEMAIAHAQCGGPRPSVLFIDLDRFKIVNDSLGHSVGDRLLSEAGRRLRRCVRGDETISRIGGDEFMILLLEARTPADAARVAEKILSVLGEPFSIDGNRVFSSASIGGSSFPADGASAEELIRSAGSAMSRAKELGGNSFQLFNPELTERALRRLAIESGLRKALERRSFVLHFQPIINLETLDVTGLEALVRWRRPGKGLIYPGDFIRIAEETRLIDRIGLWILREACSLGRRFNLTGHREVRMSINLSPRQFLDPSLMRSLQQSISASGIPPSLIEFEITETAAMEDVTATIRSLAELREMGVSVVVDDFGTGHSSLSYLKKLPVGGIKIDREFLQEVPGSPADNAIVTSIVRLAQGLGLRTTAEGIERPEQVEFLRRAGCDEGQGFLFSKPLPAEKIEEFLSASFSGISL